MLLRISEGNEPGSHGEERTPDRIRGSTGSGEERTRSRGMCAVMDFRRRSAGDGPSKLPTKLTIKLTTKFGTKMSSAVGLAPHRACSGAGVNIPLS